MLLIGIIGVYNVYYNSPKSNTLKNISNKNNISDSKAIITKNIDVNELSDEILNIESTIQEKKDEIDTLTSDNLLNKQKIKDSKKELNNIKMINIFNNTSWYNIFSILNNYSNKKEQIKNITSDINNIEIEINNNEKEITNLEIDVKNLTNKEDALKEFINNNDSQSNNDLFDEITENIDSKLIDKIKKDKIDNNQTNKDLLTTINIPEPSMQTNNLTFNRVGNLPPFIMPVHGTITSQFGYRIHPISGVKKYHSGTDIGVDTGTPVKASNYGLVIYSGWYSGFGNAVILSHADGVYTLYGHNSKLLVSKGDKVEQGETIALAGSTGYSTGPHCHFSMWINNELVNPLDYVIDNN